MSDIYFKCACGKSLAVDERGVGHTVNCVDCMELVRVPEPDFEFPCKHCGDYMLIPKSMAGKTIQCALCGMTVKVPMAHLLSLWAKSAPVTKPTGTVFSKMRFRPALGIASAALIFFAGAVLLKKHFSGNDSKKVTTAIRETAISHSASTHTDQAPPGAGGPPPEEIPPRVSGLLCEVDKTQESPPPEDTFPEVGGLLCEVDKTQESPPPEDTSPETDHPPEDTPDHVASLITSDTATSTLDPVQPEQVPVAEFAEIEDEPELESAFTPELPESGKLSGLTAELQPYVKKAGLLGEASGAYAMLKDARGTVLDYTRKYGASVPLDRLEWELPFCAIYNWSLSYELRTHAHAAAAVRETFAVLQNVSPENRASAARAMSRTAMLYAEKWMDTHAPMTIKLVDEIEAWVVDQPGGKKEWRTTFRYTQGGFLFQEHQFQNLEEKNWLWSSRQERLSAYIEEDVMDPGLRDRTLTHWARVLYYAGRGEKARDLLISRYEKDQETIPDPDFLYWLMRVFLFEEGDWEAAGHVLELANSHKDIWHRKPSHQQTYEALAWMYYDNIGLTQYGLRRARNIEKQTPVRRRDSLAHMAKGI